MGSMSWMKTENRKRSCPEAGTLACALLLPLLSVACPDGPCATSAECSSDEICIYRTCRTRCENHLDCTGNYTCQFGACLPPKKVDAGVEDAGICQGVVCGGVCQPQGECCIGSDCGAGTWICTTEFTCLCHQALCDDRYCPSDSACCSSSDCADPTWTCSDAHACECPGGVGCSDGYCRPDTPGGCCEPSDCGQGPAWSCSDHACACPGLQCGQLCVQGGNCCDQSDCLDGSHSGAWACGSDNLCHCGDQACSDGYCPDLGECCSATSCGDGDWQCANHSCSCAGPVCGQRCSGSVTCDTGQEGLCAAGEITCDGNLPTCVQTVLPTDEVCNGEDDSCDGNTDEGFHDNPAGDCVADGSFGLWEEVALALPIPYSTRAVVHDRWIYLVGGQNKVGDDHPLHDTVYRTGVDDSGDLGTQWESVGALPEPWLPEVLVYRSSFDSKAYLFALGGIAGELGAQAVTATIAHAAIEPDGQLGPWLETTAALPRRLRNFGLTVHEDRLYVAGGWDPDAPNPDTGENGIIVTDLLMAEIDPVDGDITGIQNIAPVNMLAQYWNQLIVHDGYLFIVGGNDPEHAHQYVRSAPLAADGTLATPWNEQPYLSPTNAITGTRLLIRGGHLFFVTLHRNDPTRRGYRMGQVHSAPLLANGNLGTWTMVGSSPFLEYAPAIVEKNGYVFALGGFLWNHTVYYDQIYRAMF